MSIRSNPNRSLCITVIATLVLALLHGLCFAQAGKGSRAAPAAAQGMQKVVTQQASFVLYVPNGWKAQESTDGQALQVTASDPSGRSFVFLSTGAAPQGENGTLLANDNWGTKNTATGEHWGGKPYDYVNFEGKNPKYNEQMQPVDSRALWERHIR